MYNKSLIRIVTMNPLLTCKGAPVVRVLILLLNGNQRQTLAAKIRKVLFVEKGKAAWGHAAEPGNR
jgi:hypothetical protein